MRYQRLLVLGASIAVLSAVTTTHARQPAPQPVAPPVMKIREGVYRIGTVEVDTIKKEARVAATINSDIKMLEWVANTKNGAKAYESALTVDVNAVTFNAAMLLMGLDPARSRVPTRHFDPVPPKGDPLEIWLEWSVGSSTRKVRIEELLYDERTKKTMEPGPWVYTGSAFMSGFYMAEIDGVLIGFVHSPAPIIENPGAGAVDAFGKVTMNNERLGLPGGSKVTLIVKALPLTPRSSR